MSYATPDYPSPEELLRRVQQSEQPGGSWWAWKQMCSGNHVRRHSDELGCIYSFDLGRPKVFPYVNYKQWVFGYWDVGQTKWGIEDTQANDWELVDD